MWCIFLLFAILLIIYAFIVVLAYGIKTSIRIDANNLSVCVKVYIFDWIEIIGFKIFISEEQFYYQFNKGDITLLKKQEKDDEKKEKEDKKLRTLSYIYYIVENMPKITLSNAVVEYGAQFEEIKNRAMFDGGVAFVINGALAFLQEKLEVNNLKVKNVCDESSFRGLFLEGVIKLSLLKIFFYILHILAQKRRFQKA
ncbi:MAG: hypothetical protein K2N57_03265 [Clostridia bacterium]|nr:hypothetical protein [Clostridia bacterium]